MLYIQFSVLICLISSDNYFAIFHISKSCKLILLWHWKSCIYGHSSFWAPAFHCQRWYNCSWFTRSQESGICWCLQTSCNEKGYSIMKRYIQVNNKLMTCFIDRPFNYFYLRLENFIIWRIKFHRWLIVI